MAEKKAVPTRQYKVLSNLRHNGKHYNPGKLVKLSAADAKTHIASKVVEPAYDAFEAPEAPEEKSAE